MIKWEDEKPNKTKQNINIRSSYRLLEQLNETSFTSDKSETIKMEGENQM